MIVSLLLSLFIFPVSFDNAVPTAKEAKILRIAEIAIGQDYETLLNGIIDLRKESKNANTSEKKAIRIAMDGMIGDFISGPFAIFEKGAMIQTNAKKNRSARSFLNGYASKNYSNASIQLLDSDVKIGRGGNSVVTIFFESLGETAAKPVLREATVVVVNGNAKIRAIRAKGGFIEPVSAPSVKETATPTKKKVKKRVEKVEREIPVPQVEVVDVLFSNTGNMKIIGDIDHSNSNGLLSATINNQKVNKENIRLMGSKFEVFAPAFQSQNLELVLTYNYNNKFVEVRKNVMVE